VRVDLRESDEALDRRACHRPRGAGEWNTVEPAPAIRLRSRVRNGPLEDPSGVPKPLAVSVSPARSGRDTDLFGAEGRFVRMSLPPGCIASRWLPRRKRAGAFTISHGASRPRPALLSRCEAFRAPRSGQTGPWLSDSDASVQRDKEQSRKGSTRSAAPSRSLATAPLQVREDND
jgi:hypothetical protein